MNYKLCAYIYLFMFYLFIYLSIYLFVACIYLCNHMYIYIYVCMFIYLFIDATRCHKLRSEAFVACWLGICGVLSSWTID